MIQSAPHEQDCYSRTGSSAAASPGGWWPWAPDERPAVSLAGAGAPEVSPGGRPWPPRGRPPLRWRRPPRLFARRARAVGTSWALFGGVCRSARAARPAQEMC
ncbi:unnamed protein product [Prorocentrum cordatum]|uniref:Uncharacterized protein n=1 Tax=Prorocentrum cordatum TaxID=2364126 RepID=A0ABN9Y8W2_9DINO|nr:unnamed protein product [Polarella glacialis]